MAIFRDPVQLHFVDEDNAELAGVANPAFVPRVGENVRIGGVPYTVERVGYDVPADAVTDVWVVLRPA